MSTIAAKKLHEALAKARNVGLVEEAFTIEECDLVFRNLRPDEYAAALQDCNGLEDVAYANAWQKGHITRSIVEINGVDLRDVEYVEVEEDDPTKSTKKVRLELHRYLADHMISSWGKEAIFTAFRKFSDVVELAERKAKEGVTFIVPDETDEEQYRRLLLEVRELESVLPTTLVDSILSDSGFVRKSSQEELKRVEEKTSQLARDLEVEPEPAPAPRRNSPVDPHATLQQAIANRRTAEPPALPEPVSEPEPQRVSRAAEYAALEEGAFNLNPESATEVVEVKPKPPVDHKALVIDPPVTAGINPRFKAPPRI